MSRAAEIFARLGMVPAVPAPPQLRVRPLDGSLQFVPAASDAPVTREVSLLRARLLALADTQGLPDSLVRQLTELDISSSAGLDDMQLSVFLKMLRDTAMRRAGKRPPGDTATILCARCGPVWVHPDLAAALPMVGAWPRALSCPWCFIRNAGGGVPRPRVTELTMRPCDTE
jgi:hypothetical protein